MPNYLRARVPGATFFFTANLANRNSSLLIDRIDILRRAYAATVRDAPLFCDAIVILPDHLHTVWTLPPGDAGFSERWRKIKHRFSRAIGGEFARSSSKQMKREKGIWQRRFWEHVIRDEVDYTRHVEYCWGNPVKHGLVRQAADWPFSSIHRDIRAGRVGPEWSEGVREP